MKTFVTIAALVMLATAPSMVPSQAQAGAYEPDGFVTCHAYQSDRNRVIYTRPFPAFEADADSIYGDFLVMLKSGAYILDMSVVSGACTWGSDADAAAQKTEDFKSQYSDKGATTLGVDFTYTPEADE